ncbi:MAG: DMT family transporter [Gammaproteobacteria bacterium]|nr:DMT family transporter [Gammaproteobacteria bacterium]
MPPKPTTAGHADRSYVFGVTLVLISIGFWSTAGLFARLIKTDVWTMLFWRCLFGGLSIVLWLAIDAARNKKRLIVPLGAPGFALAFITAGSIIVFINSFMHASVAEVSVIYATLPLVAAAIAWLWLREKPTAGTVAASAASLVGIGIMMQGSALTGSLLGDVLAFVMTICMAFITVISRRYPATPVVHAMALAGFIAAAVTLPLAVDPWSLDAETLGLLIAFGILNVGGGFAIYSYGARLIPSSHAALLSLLDAPLAPIWVYVFVDEVPTQATIIGGSIILLTVVWHQLALLRQSRKRRDITIGLP